MANLTLNTSATIYPGAAITTLARLSKTDGTLISQDDLSSVRMQISARAQPGTPLVIASGSATGVVVATSAATDTLLLTNGWRQDDSGYNFAHTYDTSSFLSGGNSYLMDYKITTSSIGVLHLIVNLVVKPVGHE